MGSTTRSMAKFGSRTIYSPSSQRSFNSRLHYLPGSLQICRSKSVSTGFFALRLRTGSKYPLWSNPQAALACILSSEHNARSISFTKPPLKPRSRSFLFFYRLFATTGAFFLISGGLVLAFFIYDASTYREDLTYTDIPVSEKALKPRRGGPKNLPIAEVLVDDDDSEEKVRQKNKPKLVVLGSGWGSVALLKTLNPEDYHVTVVSPVNYFLFTPMLPSATVGTLELRSLVEPIRRIVQRVQGHFLRAEAVDVELSERLLEVSQTDARGEKQHFYLPYDKLVIGVGLFVCSLSGEKFEGFTDT